MWKVCGVCFLCFRQEKSFLGKSGQKNLNCQFKLKFGTKNTLYKRDSMMMFKFSEFFLNDLFWANLVQKF